MNRRVWLKVNTFLVLLVGLAFGWGCTPTEVKTTSQPQSTQQFIMAGSGSNLPITGQLIQGYRESDSQAREDKIEMPASIGSGGAVKAVNEGAITLGLISRPLKDEEVGLGLIQVPYARVGVVIGANSNVPENNITAQDLVNIFSAKKNQWKSGDMIVVLSREKGDSSNQALAARIPGFRAALEESLSTKRWQVYYTDKEEVQGITATPYSVGFTDTATLAVQGLNIKPLMLDGVRPDIKNVANGSYPYYKDLYFIFKEPLPDRAKRFMAFVHSDQGKKIIELNGGVPLKGK